MCTFVDMLGRRAPRAQKGETGEEREEQQSSPLGHHFSRINVGSLSGIPVFERNPLRKKIRKIRQ